MEDMEDWEEGMAIRRRMVILLFTTTKSIIVLNLFFSAYAFYSFFRPIAFVVVPSLAARLVLLDGLMVAGPAGGGGGDPAPFAYVRAKVIRAG